MCILLSKELLFDKIILNILKFINTFEILNLDRISLLPTEVD